MSDRHQFKNGVLFANLAKPLPEEMLAEVFLHCVACDELSDCLPRPTSPPLTLTWVCRYWRSLAVSMPDLWTSISLGETGTDPADDVRLLDLWIERACPSKRLHISLCHEMKDAERRVFFDQNRGDRYLVGMKALTDKLLSVSHRWQTLELHALDLYVLDPVLRALVSTGAPQLEYLSISTKYFDFFGSVHFMDLTNCPALRTLRLMCPMLCPTAKSGIASKMTDLEIRFCPLIKDCLIWLTICPNLERLNVRFFRPAFFSPPRNSCMLTLPRLAHLTISGFNDDSDPTLLLDLLVLPALRELSFDMTGLVDPESSQKWDVRLLAIIKRSRAPLERLNLVGTPMSSDALIQLLGSACLLKELVLSGSIISDKLIESLAINMKSCAAADSSEGAMLEDRMTFSLCPILESLELREFECTLDTLASCIYSRCRTASGLREVPSACKGARNFGTLRNLALIWSPHHTLLEHPLIRECISGGLEITNRAYNVGRSLAGADAKPYLVGSE